MPSLTLAPVALDDAIPKEMEYLNLDDRIAVMREQEDTTYRVRDYLTESAQMRKAASKPVDEDCRVKMCEWCYQVVDFCKFRRETVVIGMSYLDRFLCTEKGTEALCNRKIYQLAAMTALYIAIKLHEPLEMETSLLADLSRGCYTEMEFVEMEQTMLQALEFRVNGPTPLSFLQHFMSMVSSTVHPTVADLVMDYARYQMELAVSEQAFAHIQPSELAIAALLNALEGMDTSLFPVHDQTKLLRRIEHATEIFVHEAELTQSKLSLLMVSLISGDYERIMGSMEDTDDTEKAPTKQYLHRRNSPKSVLRR